jgi:hypothetical protein
MKTTNKSPKPDPKIDLVAQEIRPGQSLELLKELHILTREGKLNQDSRRKLKQVYHLYGFIEKLLLELPAGREGADKGLTLADHGAGKSYLGFIIYDLFFNAANTKRLGHIYGIETRAELVQKSRELAARLGFAGMSFLNLSVAESAQSAELPPQIDIVTALHACDTATDDAIAFGLQKRAKYMVLVPCCQAEVAARLRDNRGLAALPLPRSQRLPSHRHRAGRLGAQHEKRADPSEIHGSQKNQRCQPLDRSFGAVWAGRAAADAI